MVHFKHVCFSTIKVLCMFFITKIVRTQTGALKVNIVQITARHKSDVCVAGSFGSILSCRAAGMIKLVLFVIFLIFITSQ